MRFLGIKLCFHSVMMYFVNFRFCFWCFQKLTAKFSSRLDRFKIADLAMVKVKKNQYRSYLAAAAAALKVKVKVEVESKRHFYT